MPAPLESPAMRYGMGIGSAVILTIIAFTVLDGTMRWLVLGIAVLEILVVPQIMKMAAAQSTA
ncbi:hypothetical protein SAMN05216559_2265 [Halomicrobium zhouii]|uniref:Uncharacterized protein n=1 Tax=Halomicrobium zhouii TaxID=767519 RepID=A0A1I6L8T8_9EURY|nr:hypothetical protein [Halomicrobium zhouii]SFR99814.1 hypothetical protein SAMN05216559_2265 [Halomicrobium zhouii]